MKKFIFFLTLFHLHFFLCGGNSQGGNERFSKCTLSPETLLNLQNWFNNENIKIKEDAKIELVCFGADVAETIGKGVGAAAGAGGGGILGGNIGSLLGQWVDSITGNENKFQKMGGEFGSTVGAMAGAYVGMEAGGSMAKKLFKFTFLHLFQIETPQDLISQCKEMLDVELLTSWDTVKSNFRKKAMQFHPDRPGGSHEKMTQLNVCLEILRLDYGRN